MLIWFGMWLITELLFVLLLTPAQFDAYFSSKRGIWNFIEFIPVRFFLWPFLLITLGVEIFEAVCSINRLNVWWSNKKSS